MRTSTVLPLLLCGCSALWIRSPTPDYDPARHGLPKCSAPAAAILWDAAIIASSVVGSVFAFKIANDMDAEVVGRAENSGTLRAYGVVLGVNAILHAGSFGYGMVQAPKCIEAETAFDRHMRERGGPKP